MKASKQPLLILGFVLLLGLCGFIVIKGKRPERWFSSPTELRKATTYNEVMKPEPPLTKAWKPPSQFTITTNFGNQFQMVFPSEQNTRRTVYQVEKALMYPGQPLSLGEGSIHLDSIQVAYGSIPWSKKDEWSIEMEPRVFNGQFKELSTNEIQKKFPHKYDRQIGFQGVHPQVKFNFQSQGMSAPELMDAWIFDGVTHAPFSNGRSSSASMNSFGFETDLATWRQGPVHLVMDLAYDRGEPVKMPFKSGSSYTSSVMAMTLAAIVPGRSQSWSNNSDGQTNKINISFVQDTNHKTTTVLFLVSPDASPLPIRIEYLGKNGKRLNGRGGGSTDSLLVSGYEGEPEDCEYIVITPYKTIKRVVLKLPDIPGLPEANRNVQNLFSVQMPHLRIKSEWELRQAIERTVQLQMTGANVNVPMGRFPLFLTNATPADLVEIYRTFLPPNTDMIVDHQKQEMEWVSNNPLHKFRAIVKNIFQKN
ncbi:MAG: hypothetical protein ACO1QB_11945 [Verrucomicrobiales bacterium]